MTLLRATLVAWWGCILRLVLCAAVMAAMWLGALFALAFVQRLVLPRVMGQGHLHRLLGTVFLASMVLALVPIGVAFLGSCCHAAAQRLRGEPVRVGAALAAGLRRVFPVLGTCLLCLLAITAAGLALVIPGLVVACALLPAVAAAAIERRGPLAAVRRGWELTRGARLALLGASLALSALLLALLLGVGVLADAAPEAPVTYVAVFGFLFISCTFLGLFPGVAYQVLRAAREGPATEELERVFE